MPSRYGERTIAIIPSTHCPPTGTRIAGFTCACTGVSERRSIRRTHCTAHSNATIAIDICTHAGICSASHHTKFDPRIAPSVPPIPIVAYNRLP